jgi:hypothetical protein
MCGIATEIRDAPEAGGFKYEEIYKYMLRRTTLKRLLEADARAFGTRAPARTFNESARGSYVEEGSDSVTVGGNVGDIKDGGTSRPVGQMRRREIRRAEEDRACGIAAISKMDEAVSEMVSARKKARRLDNSDLVKSKDRANKFNAHDILYRTAGDLLDSGSAKRTQLDSVVVETLMEWVAPRRGNATVGRAPDFVASHTRSPGVESQPSENERDASIHKGEQFTAQLRAADGSMRPSSSLRSVFDEDYEKKDDEEDNQD